jgi:hypothetical protein
MARAHHDAGDHLAAKRALLKALHLAPNDIKIRFNLAFVLQVRHMTFLCDDLGERNPTGWLAHDGVGCVVYVV